MRVKAHAGCEGTSDISVNSLVKAVETGADIVEVDIHRTKDGFFVVGHNDTIGELMIAENTCRQLKDAYPETITLKEALEYLADKEILLNIDYKIYDCYKEIAEEIAENKFPFERIILTGMKEGDNLSDLRKWYPGAAIYYPAPESGEILKPYLYEKYIEDCVEGLKPTDAWISILIIPAAAENLSPERMKRELQYMCGRQTTRKI